jgi:SAM-dependent methyltransferase
MRDDYAKSYRELYERHWWWRAREKFLIAQIGALSNAASPRYILDVGCGDGLFFDQLLKFGEVEGVEPDPAIAAVNGRHGNRIFHVPFDGSFRPGHKYSLILMLDVLEHLNDPAAALRNALDLLDSNGTILITVPAFRSLWTTHDDLNFHVTRFTKASFGKLGRQAGLHIESARYFFGWLFPLKLIARLGEKMQHTEPKPPAVPGPLVNSACYAISRFEQMITSAVPPPVGSSLLVIGRRV